MIQIDKNGGALIFFSLVSYIMFSDLISAQLTQLDSQTQLILLVFVTLITYAFATSERRGGK